MKKTMKTFIERDKFQKMVETDSIRISTNSLYDASNNAKQLKKTYYSSFLAGVVKES